jgi:NADH-quinone oxidoreductase subunit J
MTNLIIYLFMAMALTGALAAILIRRALYAVFWLGLALFGVAGLFLLLGSPFVGAMQLLIYIGGICVLLVFAVMLSASVQAPRQHRQPGKTLLAAAGAGVFCFAISKALLATNFGPQPATTPEAWSVAQIGHTLLTQYNLVFEALSLLLVVAIMGAILIAHRQEENS